MKQFKSRAQYIEAEQLTRENAAELALMCGGHLVEEIDPRNDSVRFVAINVPTTRGNIRLSEGQYLTRDVYGRWGTMGQRAFAELYDTDEEDE